MPQSLAKVFIHLIFSTKERRPIIHDEVRPELHRYMGGILRECDSTLVEVGSVEDHIHLLFDLSRKVSISDTVEAVKSGSSKWIKKKGASLVGFQWQAGYGAFSVSQSHIVQVQEYILGQKEHHLKKTFQHEFRSFLKKYNIPYDERYVWD
jgi:putative transposase